MEPIAPSADPADAGTPLGRFKARFGNRLHSIAWYVADIESFTARLLSNGVRLVGLTGRPVTDPAGAVAVWTHPADTGALLEFCPAGFAADPRHRAGLDDGTVAGAPARPAADVARDRPVRRPCRRPARLRRHARRRAVHSDTTDPAVGRWYYAIGEDTVVEVAVPADDASAEGRDLAAAGNAVHGVTFTTADLDRAVTYLSEQGITVTPTSDGTVHLDLDPAHGLNLFLTATTIPGDPRA